MLKGGQIPGHFGYNLDDSIEKDFEIIFKVKFTQKTKDLCFGNTSDFRQFKKEIFGYRFKDTPDYTLLRRMLEKVRDGILKNDSVFNNQLEINIESAEKTKNLVDAQT